MDQRESEVIEAIQREVGSGEVKMGTVEFVSVALSVFDKLLDKTPNYKERKKQKYLEIKEKYLFATKDAIIDSNRVDNLRDELILLMDSINNEIK